MLDYPHLFFVLMLIALWLSAQVGDLAAAAAA